MTTQPNNKFYSSFILNYIEPTLISGEYKTTFYSEINTNVNVGDKVFILNGNYDSDIIFGADKYSNGSDGYKVLLVDKCKITLDIPFTNVLPYSDENLDNFIKVYHVRSQREFDYINKLYVSTYPNIQYNKFELNYTNYIIYADGAYNGISSGTTSFGENNGITQSGFYGFRSNYTSATHSCDWINITSTFYSNSFTFSSDYYSNDGYNNGKIFIINEDIILSGLTLKQRTVYKYSNGSWIIDISHKKPILSKSIFRNGTFNGIWNDGIFGTNISKINWNNATWNSGFLVNANLLSGTFNSKSTTDEQSYYSSLDSNGQPIQSTDFLNNKGFGYNYIIDSDVISCTISNGNFYNCNIGSTAAATFSTIENHINGITHSYSLNLLSGFYNFCDINSTYLRNSKTYNSIVKNSLLHNSKIINTQLFDTLSLSSTIGGGVTEDGIGVIQADLASYVPHSYGQYTTYSTSIRGVLKLYISPSDYLNIDTFDTFYITKMNKNYILNSINNEQKILLPYETKYIFDTFYNSNFNTLQCLSTKSSINENKYKYSASFTASQYGNYGILNNVNLPSIDIDLGSTLAYYLTNITTEPVVNYVNSNPLINFSNVNYLFTDTYINTSDYRSGILEKSTWASGANINDFSNIIGSTSSLRISTTGTNSLTLTLMMTNSTINDDNLSVNSIVSLDSIDFICPTHSYSLSGFYKITSNTIVSTVSHVVITDFNDNKLAIINSLSGTYSVGVNNPNYISVNRFMMNSSEVNSGLFDRTHMKNTLVNAIGFDNTDKTLSLDNINKLRLNNVVFKDNNLTMNSGLIYKSHIYNGTWSNGILYNSIWNAATFNNGVFKGGYWLDGTFNNGVFMNCDGVTPSTIDYDNYKLYNSWLDGTFNNGEFNTSTWINGTFNGGKFYRSNWYCGVFNNGTLGDKNIAYSDTTLASLTPLALASSATYTVWNNGTVDNAKVGGAGTIVWKFGKFNGGVFTTDLYNPSLMSVTPSSIWMDGIFSNSVFSGNSRWLGGTLSNSKFTSYYGWTNSNSLTQSDYSWENGVFLSGQFGVSSFATNSTWYTGQFKGGQFNGRVWNNGIFISGIFNGGVTISATNSEVFIDTYTSSYYGMWRDGWVIDNISIARPMDKIFSNIIRSKNKKEDSYIVTFNNMLWLGGTFSHRNGYMNNSLWLDGKFNDGEFNNSVFNPYVDRTLSGSSSLASFMLSDTCLWNNGKFNGGEFYISEWKNGSWIDGTMSGGVWRNGIWYYGNAYNTYWENGIWKNGNWDGSPYDYDLLIGSYSMSAGKEHDMLIRISQISATNSIHLINAFSGTQSAEVLRDPHVDYSFIGWTYSQVGANTEWVPETQYSYSVYPFSGPPYSIAISDKSLSTLCITPSNVLKAIGTASGTTDIFTDLNQKYNVSIKFLVELGTAAVQIVAGSYVTQSIFSLIPSYSDFGNTYPNPPSIYTINFTYQPIYASASKELTIQKLSYGSIETKLYVLDASVIQDNISYDSTYNNALYAAMPISATYGSTVSFPSSLILTTIASGTTLTSNFTVGLKFGNGVFKSGIWENGVWNNGWRYDYNLLNFHTISQYLKVTPNVWRLQLVNNDGVDMNTKLIVGDRIIVGNIVLIDINENRKLLKSPSSVVYVSNNFIIIEVVTNFPIRRIEIDSSSHIIYVSKNIWLSGAFLNGYFSGIWSYGLFKGYPHITRMNNSHMIDGIFDGGRFSSSIGTYSNLSNYGISASYNTGLVQNFSFRDNNIAPLYTLLYNSWMDVNYDNTSMTNIGQNFTNFDPYTNTEFVNINLNGYPTVDVLSSDSTFRDGYRNRSIKYNLGTKFKRYIDYLNSGGDFLNYFDGRNQENFINDSWTYSKYDQTSGYSYGYENTYSQDPGNPLGVLVYTASFHSGSPVSPSTDITFNKSILNNIDANQISSSRYSTIEFGLLDFNINGVSTGATCIFGPSAYPGIYFGNTPATYSAITQSVNHVSKLHYTGITDRIEYFYGRKNINMNIILQGELPGFSTQSQTVKFDYIKFYEVDMIPFFKYAETANINHAISAPLKGFAPRIDYNNTSFNFIGNISLTTDAITNYLSPAPPSIAFSTAIYSLVDTSASSFGI